MSTSSSQLDTPLLPQPPLPAPKRAATMADVARVAGVTKMTVSYALSGKRPIAAETRRVILEAAQELNFSMNAHAQRLAGGRSQRDISLYSVNLSVGVDMLKVSCIRQKLQDLGYTVSFHSDNSSGTHQSATLALLRSQRPAAIVCETTELQEVALDELRKYQDEGGIVVCYDHSTVLDCDQVVYAHEDSLYMVTRHLMELGHRRLGLHVLGPARSQEPQFVRNSEHGFEKAVAEFGGEAPLEWRFRGLNYENHEEGGALTAKEWLSRPRETWPTAICLVNDSAAAAFVATMLRAGVRVPEDVSVVGTDDLPVALYNAVQLTTVTHPVTAVAEHIVELLVGRLQGQLTGPTQKIVVRGELVARESSAAPPLLRAKTHI